MAEKKARPKKTKSTRAENLVIMIFSALIAVTAWVTLSITAFSDITVTLKDVPIDFSLEGSYADLSGLSTFITYDIMKEQEEWSHGVINRLYIADENNNYADLDYVIESDDRYTVVIKLALLPDEEKVVKKLCLYADTADEKGILLNDFGSVVIENMNVKS